MEIGQMCVKLAGRDAGQKCVVVEKLDEGFVKIDGETRRRKCNVKHLQPMKESIDISEGASHEEVKEAFEEMGLEARETSPKEETERPKKQKVVKGAPEEEEPEEDTEESSEEEAPTESQLRNMTKDEIKEKGEEFGIELSTNDLKDEMIEQFLEEL